jgi:cytoskeletal protein CcmA (bactofilin family)
VFKKVIGQEVNESQKPLQVVTEPRPSVESSNFVGERSATPAPRPATNTRNVLSSDVEIKGTVKFQHDLIVDGKIEGDIQSTGNLTIGENARIKAEVKTGSVIVYGKIHGNLTAVDRVELKSSAEVVGDIKAKILMIEAGAIFVGKSTVGTPSQATPSQPELKAIVSQAAPSQAVEVQPSLAEK